VNKNSYILVLLVLLMSAGVQAQVDSVKIKLPKDSVARLYEKSIVKTKVELITDSIKPKAFKPDPLKVVTWNSGRYQSYKTAYMDILRYNSDVSYQKIVDKNHSAVSFYQILPKGYSIEQYGGFSGYTAVLKTAQDGSRRYRDLSIIATIGYYALTIVDAYVDAQLYDFDISPNLSMHVQPALMENRSGLNNTLGLQCSISLR